MQSNRHTPPGSLERAIEIAAEAHAGQTDKGGAPYVLHPLRVMLALTDPDARIAAVLHDVVEDGRGWSFERLKQEGFSERVIAAVRAVTKQADEAASADASPSQKREAYLRFVHRAAQHPIGRQVKRADLEDNLDTSRLHHPLSDEDEQRLSRYRDAQAILRGAA